MAVTSTTSRPSVGRPGDTADPALIRQVKDDMRAWTFAKIVWVADRGFASANNRYVRNGDHH